MSDIQEQLDNILKQIPQSSPLFLFPLKLETHFRKQGEQNQLCVRIIPDEILLNYYNEFLTKAEEIDGRFFWFQWYIASGNEKREKEAWKVLCSKYPVHRAAWICKVLKPIDIENKRPARLRPYYQINEIEKNCAIIYETLADFIVDEEKDLQPSEGKDSIFEKNIIEKLSVITTSVYSIHGIFKGLKDIVDYLYDSVVDTLDYLQKRLNYYQSIYEKYKQIKDNVPVPSMQDNDYGTLINLQNEILDVLNDIKNKKISLSDKVAQLNKDEKNFFPTYKIIDDEKKESLHPDITIPTADLFPKQFFFIGEIDNDKKDIIYAYSEKVSESIKIALDFNQQYKIDENKNLEFDETVKWMFDYEEAVKKGMAITVNIDSTVKKFNYIYVLGIKNQASSEPFEKLFNGHNFFSSSIQYLKTNTPTNIVEGNALASRNEELMEKRFDIEVNESYRHKKGVNASILSELFANNNDEREKIYNSCFGHIVESSRNQEEKTIKEAYKKIWNLIKNNLPFSPAHRDFLETFIEDHVRASGSIPFIRVKNRPYGILPTSDFMKIRESIQSSNIKDKENLLAILNDLIALANKWKDLRKSTVITSSNLKKDGDESPEARYIQMAGQTPYSVSFIERMSIDSPLIEKNNPSPLNANGMILDLIKNEHFSAEPIRDAEKDASENIDKDLIEALNKDGFSLEDAKHYTAEFLDLFTYRLDAWFSGILDYIRKNSSLDTPSLGAYGWVFDLEKNDGNSSQKDDHFILAPSIQHALSAAVLRCAYNNSRKDDERICVNLSSMRVRQALRLIDGIKNGMSMSVVLGSDLERYLHDANNLDGTIELDKYIVPLRKRFKQTINIEAEDEKAQSYLMQVINGEELLSTIIKKWNWEGSLHDWLENNFDSLEWPDELKDIKGNAKQAFFRIIERLMDSYDALNDLLLSESVHRLIMGDKASFYAIGNFIATGKGNIPDPEILKFPSERVVIAHKAGIILPQAEKEPIKALSIADPAVNSWIESLFGTANIGFTIKVDDKAEQNCTLNDLGISGAEYLYLSAYPQTFTKYLEVLWRIKNNYFGGIITIDQDSANTQLSLGEDTLRIETLRKILKAGQGMNATDLAMELRNELQDDGCIDSSDLENRYQGIHDIAQALLGDMKTWLNKNKEKTDYDEKNVRVAYELFCRCIELGMINTHIDYDAEAISSEEVQKTLYQNMEDARENLSKRITSAKSEADKCSAIQTLTLKNVKVFPKFKLDSEKIEPNTETTQDKINEAISTTETSIVNGISQFTNITQDTFEVWEDEIAEVRRGMKEMHNQSLFQTALGKDFGSVSILQKSAPTSDQEDKNSPSSDKKDKWMGWEVEDEADLRDADSLLLYNKDAYKGNSYNSGFIFDSWIEYIPYKKHNAGLVFHCNRPDNEAPQALLYTMYPSVSPSKEGGWNLDAVKEILATTRFMMMNRAVEPDAIYEDMELSRMFPLIKKKKK